MHWSSPAFVLSFRAHGEWDARVCVFSKDHGRYMGLVKGGQSQKNKNQWQPGHLANVTWRARLFEHLGFFTGEAVRDYSAALLSLPLALATLSTACALIEAATPERMALPDLYEAFEGLLPLDEGADDLARYVRFELEVLKALGYGLDLSTCALTSTTRDLHYVSPKTGRAVNKDVAAPWIGQLLPLPAFLREEGSPSFAEAAQGLRVTGYFLERHVFANLPGSSLTLVRTRRQRLLDLVEAKVKVAAVSQQSA
jgi:DNA repair protein RecO (recombination protein O)